MAVALAVAVLLMAEGEAVAVAQLAVQEPSAVLGLLAPYMAGGVCNMAVAAMACNTVAAVALSALSVLHPFCKVQMALSE